MLTQQNTGVAAIIGAYIAGVAISVTDFKHEVFEKVETISYSIFVPVFFTSIGVTVEFAGITDNIVLIAILCVLAILTKLIGSAIGAKAAGFGWNSSLGIGSAMVSRGEVALIIAAIGLEATLLSQEMFAVLVVVVLVTTIVTPPMMKLFFKSNPQQEINQTKNQNNQKNCINAIKEQKLQYSNAIYKGSISNNNTGFGS